VAVAASAGAAPLWPAAGGRLEILTDRVLELRLTRAASAPAVAVAPAQVLVEVDGSRLAVETVRTRDWLVSENNGKRDGIAASSLTVTLRAPLPQGRLVRVRLGSTEPGWSAPLNPRPASPAIHVSRIGYQLGLPMTAFVGALDGHGAEIGVPPGAAFGVETPDGRTIISGRLTARPDRGMPGNPAAYQHVWAANLSPVAAAGTYRLRVAGVGLSEPFSVGHAPVALLARAYALGLYHQRCGAANALPFSRFVHGRCHLAAAAVPDRTFTSVNRRLAGMSAARPPQTAPPLSAVDHALFPARQAAPVDVSGGHHDAGDYGKYVINGALLVHALMIAVDLSPGAAMLDNLGVPESGDGAGDLLQEALREADFLARMQDADGGFWFMVQPRDRPYESDRLPDRGDPQVVFPKNTAATAAAVAALAQAGSSPRVKVRDAARSARYLAAATRGWAFLEQAWSRLGRDAAYQALNGYGDIFGDRDEAAWAATEVYLATGSESAHARLLREFDPSSPAARRWGWWRMFEGYGAASRSYALAAATGRGRDRRLDATHLARSRAEIIAWGRETARAAADSAYGLSYPIESKRGLRAGWLFAEDAIFDLVIARIVQPAPELEAAIGSNLAFLGGAGPTGVAFVTGVGRQWPINIVNQFARNDRRVLPPSGIPAGNLREGTAAQRGIPIYDRFTDRWDVTTESTVTTMGRGLAATALLMADTTLAAQAWRPPAATIVGVPAGLTRGAVVTLSLRAAGLTFDGAQIIWESAGHEPMVGAAYTVTVDQPGPWWVEAEAVWPDGRRVSAVIEAVVR